METSISFLRLMSFNIRLNTSGDGPHAWPYRKDLAASILHLHQPDVVGLQEALPDQVDDLAARLPDFAWVGVGRDDGVRQGEFAAIFYRRARLTLLDQGTFWLSQTPNIPGSLGWDAACIRIVTWAAAPGYRNGDHVLLLQCALRSQRKGGPERERPATAKRRAHAGRCCAGHCGRRFEL